jgi:hypothetical protein
MTRTTPAEPHPATRGLFALAAREGVCTCAR